MFTDSAGAVLAATGSLGFCEYSIAAYIKAPIVVSNARPIMARITNLKIFKKKISVVFSVFTINVLVKLKLNYINSDLLQNN
jgi:hypothetical protein